MNSIDQSTNDIINQLGKYFKFNEMHSKIIMPRGFKKTLDIENKEMRQKWFKFIEKNNYL